MANEDSPNMLQQQQISDMPRSMFYIPNFISEDEEQRILEKVCLSPSHRLPNQSNLTQSTDPHQPLDIPQTPPPPSHPSPTHRKQYSSRLDQNAALARHSRRRSNLFTGHIRRRASRHQPLPDQRVSPRPRDHAARRWRCLLPRRGDRQFGRKSRT
jgi:hypothetical protein